MLKVEVVFEAILPRVAHAIGFLYRIKLDGRPVPGALKINFSDPFLAKYRAKPVSGPDPVRFSFANEALLVAIGSLYVKALIGNSTPEQISLLCSKQGEEPIGNISHETYSDRTLDDILERLRKIA